MKTHRMNLKRRQIVLATAGALLAPLAGCGGGGGGDNDAAGIEMGMRRPSPIAGVVTLPTGSAFLQPTRLANTSAAPGSFVAALSAAPASIQLATAGAATTVWAFNGLSPGPLIEVREGDSVRITFTNQLSQPSTIHWHGLPVPPDQDGNPMDPVPPGASRTYAFTLPPGCAGTYWYHPHTHETTHEQVFRGLAGCLIVRPAIEPLAGIAERVMMVTDLRLDANNQIAANTIQDSTFGREGDHLLINGAKLPTLSVQPGATERWRIINATNARYLRLALTGHTLRIAGFDGGLIEQAQTVNEVLLAPAQRVELIVQASTQANQSFTLLARSYQRGMMMSFSAETSLLTLRTSAAGAAAAVVIPALLRAVPAMPAPVRTQSVVLSDTMGM
nr:multicopper oxidase family protein [Burkholderiales bacterium]